MAVTADGRQWSIFLAEESATLQLASRMAACLPPAGPLVIHLRGDLGTGKTTLTRGMLHALGWQGAVRSPTYGLITEYRTGLGLVLHLDLYRLRDPEELAALGLMDYLSDSALWLIEWPEQADGARLPPADLNALLEVKGTGRSLQLVSESEAGRKLLTELNPDSV
jgi:tRNA threonylcarbamoyladenosine biosynthesis protein TsaE